MKRTLIATAIVLFWLAATAWLLVREIRPGFLARAAAGYKQIFAGGLMVADNWMKITLRGRPIGYSHTQIESDDDNPAAQYAIDNETVLNLNVMGVPQRIRVSARASMDALYHLQEFLFALSSGGYALGVNGRRREGETFDVLIRTGGNAEHTRVRIPDDVVIYSPMLELLMKELKPGRQMRVRTFNPATLAPGEIAVKALRTEPYVRGGATNEATVLSAEYQGMDVLTWIDANGRVLRQETPLGWVLEACDAREAMAADRQTGESADLLRALAVPCSAPVADPRTRESLRLRLRGGAFGKADLAGGRQTVETAGPLHVDLLVRRETLPDADAALGTAPADCAPHLKATPFIQSDHEDLRRKAREIVGAETNALKAALAIGEWVHRAVRKEPAVSVPSALEVLRALRGDCNEHTYLFVGLARAAGLPARVTVGLVYNEGAFYYHAWPAVYAGRWVEMDPTFGQPAVDATHIRLMEGELQEQMRLMGCIGRLSVDILPQER